MNASDQKERARLLRLWATRRATPAQIARAMELDRKAGNPCDGANCANGVPGHCDKTCRRLSGRVRETKRKGIA